MKKLLLFSAIILSMGIRLNATEDSDSLGLPGDNLDLAGVLNLFQTATSLEDFETKLNDPANEVNNLDLNADGNVDFIRVVDQVSENAHAIVLQVPINADESQDVAVIEIENNGTESAQLQISGDEELYGENYFVEPTETDDNVVTPTTEQKFQGFRPVVVFVNVWGWPCVRYIYAPAYVVWVSPYHWNYYPNYWKPWHPVMWRVHHERVMRYHHRCVYVHECRMRNAHTYYGAHRISSPSVHRTYAPNHQRVAGQQAQKNSPASTQKTSGKREDSNPKATGKTAKGGNKKAQAGQKGGNKKGQAGPRGGKKGNAPKGNRGGGKRR